MANTTTDDFNYWVADMDDALERFFERLPAEQRASLDYTPESLDVLEKWILEKYPATKAMLVSDEALVVDGLARYIGETFRKNLGGHWDINLEDPSIAFYGRPTLQGFPGKMGPQSPQALATTAADRRKGTFLRTVLQNLQKRNATAEGK